MKVRIHEVISLLAITGGMIITPVFADSKPTTSPSKKEVGDGLFSELYEQLKDYRVDLELGKTVDVHSVDFKTFEQKIQSEINELEGNWKNLRIQQRNQLISSLSMLADLYSPHEMRTKPKSTPTNENFARANQYKLKAIKLVDAMNPDKMSVVETHRELLNWYSDRGRTEEVTEQASYLSRLLNTRDPNIIYPNFRIFCGRSARTDSGLACGMG